MVNLTFGEQVKIILSRKGMTIKELAEKMEAHTGKPMSRQNLTQRLSRDNFQEKDMRLISEILGCKFELSIMEEAQEEIILPKQPITVGDLLDMSADIEQHNERIYQEQGKEIQEKELQEKELQEKEIQDQEVIEPKETNLEENKQEESEERKLLRKGVKAYYKKSEPAEKTEPEERSEIPGELNPYTRKEYKNNSVRIHPKRIGYVQVYDAQQHKWTEMTEWAFLGYQERKKKLLGKDYEPPIYLD